MSHNIHQRRLYIEFGVYINNKWNWAKYICINNSVMKRKGK